MSTISNLVHPERIPTARLDAEVGQGPVVEPSGKTSDPARAPALDGHRLLTALRIRYGPSTQGAGPNTAAIADAHGVSRRTVQRWLHAVNTDVTAGLPPARRAELVRAVRPPNSVLRDESRKARNAKTNLDRLAMGRSRGIREEWLRQHWLEAHLVVVTDVPRTPLRQVSIMRADRRPLDRVVAHAATVDWLSVDNRFEAELVKAWVLYDVDQDRVAQPARGKARGNTETWLAPTKPRALELLSRRETPPS